MNNDSDGRNSLELLSRLRHARVSGSFERIWNLSEERLRLLTQGMARAAAGAEEFKEQGDWEQGSFGRSLKSSELLQELMSADEEDVAEALQSLIETGQGGTEPEIVERAAELLMSRSNRIRDLAASALGGMGERAANSVVLRKICELIGSGVPFAWDTATVLLRRLGPALANPELKPEMNALGFRLERLLHSENHLARDAAFQAFGALPGIAWDTIASAPIEAWQDSTLITVFQSEPDPVIVGSLGGLAALLSDPVIEVRTFAVAALKRMSGINEDAIKAIAARLGDADTVVRQGAQGALSWFMSRMIDAATANLIAWPRLLTRSFATKQNMGWIEPALTLSGGRPSYLDHPLWVFDLSLEAPSERYRGRPGDFFKLNVQLPDEARRLIAAKTPLHIAVLWSDSSGLYCISPREGYEASHELAPDGQLRLPGESYYAVGSAFGLARIQILLAAAPHDPFDGLNTDLALPELAERLTRIEETLIDGDMVPWWTTVLFEIEIAEPSS